jgi:predicted Zn-dependent peptidase
MRVLCLSLAFLLTLGGTTEAQTRVYVSSEPGTPVVAAEILLSIGPADEEDEQAGLAYLAARTVMAPIQPVLDSIGAHVNLLPEKDAISFSIVSAPDVWQEATELLAVALFREAPDSLTMIRERASIAGELRGRSANPADAATRAIDRAFFGADHPWGRPTVGTPESIVRLQFGEVEEFLRENFTPSRAFAVALGPLDSVAAPSHLQTLLGPTPAAPVELIPFEPAERPVRVEYNSITTWVAASFLFPETADQEAMRFIGYLAAADLSFSPLQRSVYNVESEVVTRVGGGEIRLQVVVPPEETEEWEERVAEVMSRIADSSMLEDVYDGHLRRYAGERLMALAAPEDRAHFAARRLLVRGEAETHIPVLEGLTQEHVSEAAASLGPPTIILLGPTLDN